jgi:predicted extracellular nuclease
VSPEASPQRAERPRRSRSRLLLLTAFAGIALPPGIAAETSIAAVQGNAPSSPLAGGEVTVTGIVTGDFQDGDKNALDNLGGFYIQSSRPDDDAATSDGVFVYDGPRPRTDVRTGQRVRVTGKVQEHYGETQIAAARVSIIGEGSIAPATLDLPARQVVRNADDTWVADLEAYEGMLVSLPQQLTVTGLRHLERFGEVVLSAGGRLYQFTNVERPGAAGYEAWKKTAAARSLVLDDGKRDNNPVPLRYLDAPGTYLRTGDTVAGLTGVLRYSRGSGGSGTETWRLMPVAVPRFSHDNPRPAAPEKRGTLRVAGFNVLNFFSGLDTGRRSCGPQGTDGCRGADDEREQARQLAKLVTALDLLDADIAGLVELENDADNSLAALVEALNAASEQGPYDFVRTGPIGRDAIRTGLFYKPAAVRPVGPHATLTARDDLRFNDSRNHPALAQTFATPAGGRLTVVVNHLKSKGSDCDDEGDPNAGDGQGNCNLTRTRAMVALADWLADDPTGNATGNYLVIGDFNAYLNEDPVRVFEDAGFVNLLRDRDSPAYSFVYDARAGALDLAFASGALAPSVRQAQAWHINADEAPVHDYNLEFGRDPAIFDATTPARSSDHDPIVVDLELGE